MRYKATNNKGEYGMTGVWLEIKKDFRRDMKTLPIEEREYIDVALFTTIINLYLQCMFFDIINKCSIWKLHNKFGFVYVVKSLCIRYNPSKIFFVREEGKLIRKKQKIQLINGRIAHFFWDTGKKWRMYRFMPARKYKRQMMENFYRGAEYTILDLKNYGRQATSTYIQYVK